jgi:hypothetical protein
MPRTPCNNLRPHAASFLNLVLAGTNCLWPGLVSHTLENLEHRLVVPPFWQNGFGQQG